MRQLRVYVNALRLCSFTLKCPASVGKIFGKKITTFVSDSSCIDRHQQVVGCLFPSENKETCRVNRQLSDRSLPSRREVALGMAGARVVAERSSMAAESCGVDSFDQSVPNVSNAVHRAVVKCRRSQQDVDGVSNLRLQQQQQQRLVAAACTAVAASGAAADDSIRRA